MHNFFRPWTFVTQESHLASVLNTAVSQGYDAGVSGSPCGTFDTGCATIPGLEGFPSAFPSFGNSAASQVYDVDTLSSLWPAYVGEGFGINTDLYETNILNLAVVLFVVINFGGSVITDILSLRRTEILNALSTAEARAQEAKEQIQKEEAELKSIETKAQILLDNAKKNAERGRSLLLDQHKKDLSDTYDAFILRKFVEQREVTDGLRAMAQNFACLRATARLEKSMAQKDHLLIMDKGLELFSKNL